MSDGAARQPYQYVRTTLVEPDWTRLPGWRTVTREQWHDAQWQRAHCIKNPRQLRAAVGDLLTESFHADRDRGVHLAVHTHANHARSVTPLVARAARAMLDAGVRDVRNQGVVMRGVNATAADLLDLCFALHGEAGIVPYYFYMCDMVPHAEHWRVSVHEAQLLQDAIMGYLPGYGTPRIVCDVPYVGKRWVHQVAEYDRERGISYWTEARHTYYDPISTLPESGRAWWSATNNRLIEED
ncbi:MAG: hypothetical protein ACM30G_04385 [Micromonosporaceae bacterium]